MPKQAKITMAPDPGVRRQIAALPFRAIADRLEVCLVTTRETGRWTIPKGWPMKKRKDHVAARIEAEQEAGVSGTIGTRPIGSYRYFKRLPERFELVLVTVYPLSVTKTLETWKEKSARQVHWTSLQDASVAVEEPELRALLREIAGKPDILLKLSGKLAKATSAKSV